MIRYNSLIRETECPRARGSLHASDVLLVHVPLEPRIEVVPPLVQHALADELKPRRELERGIPEHVLQVVLGYVTAVADFVGVDVGVHIGFYEEDVVDYGMSALLLPHSA
jgi:hypothetical protein